MIMNSADDVHDLKLQNLIKRIKELQEIVSASKPKLSQEIPTGYTATRWQLALQSFNERLPALKSRNFFSLRSMEKSSETESENTEIIDDEFLIDFGPEWDLKCAQYELEDLLNKTVAD